MKWTRVKEVSADDLDRLARADSPLFITMLRHKLILKYDPNDLRAKLKDIGLMDTKGLFHIRDIHERGDSFEILFELDEDRDMVEQYLTQYKLGMD